MPLLVIDTAANLCSAAVADESGGVIAARSEDIGKGHAEALMPAVDAVMREAGIGYGDLTGLLVSVGPGSFTGIRIGVAAARGFALALGIPAQGDTTLAALAHHVRAEAREAPVLVAIDAKAGEAHVAAYGPSGEKIHAPAVMALGDAAALIEPGMLVAGSAAPLLLDLAPKAGARTGPTLATAPIAAFCALAAQPSRLLEPKPLYLRGSGAKPPGRGAILTHRAA